MLDFQGGLKLASGVVDLAKNIKDLAEKSGSLELKEKAANLRSQTIDLKETVNDMRDRIRSLEEQLEFKNKLHWDGKTFFYEENGRKIHICNGCQASGKQVHMTESKEDNGYHKVTCPVCNNEIIYDWGHITRLNFTDYNPYGNQ